MSPTFGLAADVLVAVLLVAAIATCLRLSRRIARFKADEAAMRATVASLVAATDAAERAIAGLRSTIGEADRALGLKLAEAGRLSDTLVEQAGAASTVLERIDRIAELSRRAAVSVGSAASGETRSGPNDLLAAAAASAQAVAERAARRLASRAA